jgi:hypothetical protein
MTNTTTTTAKKTSKIGASVTCSGCGHTYGDHAYLCELDTENAKFFAPDRLFRAGGKV